MKIEVLYFAGCPNHVPAMEAVQDTLHSLGRNDEIHQVEIRTQAEAEAMGFVGSPSIRINGADIELWARTAQTFWPELSHLLGWFAARRRSIERTAPSRN
jgi:hypothetical protein